MVENIPTRKQLFSVFKASLFKKVLTSTFIEKWLKECITMGDKKKRDRKYKGSPDSTNFVIPGNRTIAKIVLSWD